MSHACHRFKCYKTITFCSLLTRCTIPCACHAKRRFNVQKWRVHVVLCRFWLRNVLSATTACTFWASQLLKVLRRMILCDRCSTSYDSWQAQYFRQVEWKNRKSALVRGRQLCTQLSIFEGGLAELFRFWCCQLRKLRKSRTIPSFLTLSSSKLRKSRRIAALLMLSSSKSEDVSQNSFGFKLADRRTDGRTDGRTDR